MKLKKGRKILSYILVIFIIVNTVCISSEKSSAKSNSQTLNIPGSVTANSLIVRTNAGTDKPIVMMGKTQVILTKNKAVTIISEKTVSNKKWYRILFNYNNKKMNGYVTSDYVKIAFSKKVKINAIVAKESPIKVRKEARLNKSYLAVDKKKIFLNKGTKLVITKEAYADKKSFVKSSFTYKKKNYSGYLLKEDIKLLKVTQIESKPTTKPTVKPTTKPTTKPTVKPTTKPDVLNSKTGKVTTKLRVRKGPGTKYDQLIDTKKEKIFLVKDQKVTILKEQKVGVTVWYKVKFTDDKKNMQGYISGDYVVLDKKDNNSDDKDTNDKDTNDNNTNNNDNDTNNNDNNIDDELNNIPLTDEEFEVALTNNNFPESYKKYLRALHVKHPLWRFKAYETGMTFENAVNGENEIGKNLIPNSKNIAWKSMDVGAYSWEDDKFIPFDGSSWVTTSKAGLKYYMDPRNFITESGIFQFEALNYEEEHQNLEGVENILKNTPLYKKTYLYKDDITGENKSTTYGKTFMEAAKISGVSPYHLASRVKQEVVTSNTSLSSVTSGNIKGYEGYYNFYNIGATHSTAAGGARINAMKYAKGGQAAPLTKEKYLLPWTTPYKAIVGGAIYIGVSYVNRGQNTGYLQKFNVTPISTFTHQYMANVQAPTAEAIKTYSAYVKMEEIPLSFNIPVYQNMPEQQALIPTNMYSPNNWLKNLNVSNYNLTPTFDIESEQEYNLIVENNISNINILATPVSSKATVSGNGIVLLKEGNNKITVNVTAENGNVRKYVINVIREF